MLANSFPLPRFIHLAFYTLADSPADPFVEDQRAPYVLVAEAFAALHAGADEVARIPHRNTNETRPTSFRHGK